MTTIASPDQEVVDKAVQKVTQIATLPEITAKIIQVVEDPKSTARDLHQIIKHDVALAAKILKVVNSAFYGLPRQVGSVDRAIVLLGLSTVKNIAIATSITKLFRGRKLSTNYGPKQLWQHSLAVGVFCKMLAEAKNVENCDEIFVAGMMHDIGIVVEMQIFPNQLVDLIDGLDESGQTLWDAEGVTFGADHQAFGAGLANKWKFPHMFQLASGCHHEPMKISGPGQEIACAVHLAETLACHKGIGFDIETDEYQTEALDVLAITGPQIAHVLEQFPEKYESAEAVLS